MKIGLINPGHKYKADPRNWDLVHLPGIAWIGAKLKSQGHQIKVVDFMHDKSASLRELEDYRVVGIASYLNGYQFLRTNLPPLKREGKTVIVGGPLVSSYGLSERNLLMRTFPEIDFGVIGEGELATSGLIKHLEQRTPLPRGIVYREGREIKTTGLAEQVENLDDLPEIDLKDWQSFTNAGKGVSINVLMSRGCYNKCSYCYHENTGVRSFSLSRIERELRRVADLRPRQITFGDDVWAYSKDRVMGMVRILKEIGLPYVVETRVNDLDPEKVRIMADSGCKQIKFGIESFSQEILNRAHKNVRVEDIYRAVKLTQDAGMEANAFLLFGLPGETKKTIQETLRGIEETRVIPRARLFIPIPGTEIYRSLLEQGKIDELKALKDFSHPAHFDSVKGNWVPINLCTGVSDKELVAARDEANAFRKQFIK